MLAGCHAGPRLRSLDFFAPCYSRAELVRLISPATEPKNLATNSWRGIAATKTDFTAETGRTFLGARASRIPFDERYLW
ncbi:MAG: hypothetical protein DMG08_19550 [Acidobacteria bacterium]|nr:MAG: hypothetical protein DMG08_19550 [Acidobacteriota bacterium]PYV06755.1 MAG: hypothetical protein DMG10_00895 [Acidobacteriota bacterium]